MNAQPKESIFANLKNDLPASLVVFLVAVPLCLGIALASGAPLFSGIIAGMVGGIVVGIASGSRVGVSGPAAGLAVIVLSAIQELGAFEIFLAAVVLAGVIQIILGFLKAGIIGYYFPSSVIKGMLSGIGLIIILKQIPHAFGYDHSYEGDLSFLSPDGGNTFSEILEIFNYVSAPAIIVTVLSLAILVLWERPVMKKRRVFQVVQGPLIVVLAGIGLNLVFQNTPGMELAADQVVSIPVAGSLTGFFGQFTFPDFSQITNPAIYVTALTIAVVASLETLLCVEATDKLDPEKHVTPTNRELKAQGLGNILSGLIGGLPVTQVIVRSSANIQSGGKTKLSVILHGVLLLFCAMAIPRLLNMIPLASLAAILFLVGYKLAKPALFKQMYGQGWSQFIPFVVTIVGIIFTDLLVGIGLGMVVAIFNILYRNYKTPYFFHPEGYEHGQPIRIALSEEVTFLNKASILQTLNHMPEDAHVIIDATKSVRVDHDVREIIEDFRQNAKTKNITLEVIGLEKSEQDDPLKSFQRVVFNGNGNSNSAPKVGKEKIARV